MVQLKSDYLVFNYLIICLFGSDINLLTTAVLSKLQQEIILILFLLIFKKQRRYQLGQNFRLYWLALWFLYFRSMFWRLNDSQVRACRYGCPWSTTAPARGEQYLQVGWTRVGRPQGPPPGHRSALRQHSCRLRLSSVICLPDITLLIFRYYKLCLFILIVNHAYSIHVSPYACILRCLVLLAVVLECLTKGQRCSHQLPRGH